MGQIQNKTYTAPNGTVYRVEDDGSITKIKGGMIQSNEPPSKYQITPEGKIYRVESDGSVTYLGNAEEKTETRNKNFTSNPLHQKKTNVWIWIVIVLIVLLIVSFLGTSVLNSSMFNNRATRIPPDTVLVEEIETYAPLEETKEYVTKIDINKNIRFRDETSTDSMGIVSTISFFAEEIIFYGETSATQVWEKYFPSGKYEHYGRVKEDGEAFSSIGVYYIEDGVIHTLLDDKYPGEYIFYNNQYDNGELKMRPTE